MLRQCLRAWNGGAYGRCESRCVPGSQACTPDARKWPGSKTQCWCGFAGDSPLRTLKSASVTSAQRPPEIGHPWQLIRLHSLAGIFVRRYHVHPQLLAHHSGDFPTHRVRLPAGGQHQLEIGCTLRAAQCHHQRGELGAGTTGLNTIACRRIVDCWRRWSLLANSGVSGLCQQVAVVSLDDPATQQQPLEGIRARRLAAWQARRSCLRGAGQRIG